MAKIKNNILLMGVSGMFGGQMVVRQTKHGTIGSHAPRKRSGEGTEGERKNRERFRQAIAYAKTAADKPEYKALAAKRNLTAFNVATSDFLHPPEVKSIELGGYQGAVGDVVEVVAVDDVMVASVEVVIVGADEQVIEEGVMVRVEGDLWRYVATVECTGQRVTVRVEAVDLAGQRGVGERGKRV